MADLISRNAQSFTAMKKYWTVAALGWQDSLVYRFNALVWVLYAVLPSLTLMLVWIAAYRGHTGKEVGGYDLSQMMTYYLFVTALSVVITPNPEWEMAQLIRDGKITPFIVRPMGFFGYKLAQETSYQIIKSAMFFPAFLVLLYLFREYVQLPPLSAARGVLFVCSCLLAYALLTQMKFLLGISAFWLAEVGGLVEIGNILLGVFGGRMLPLEVLPSWLRVASEALPFASLYVFPMQILMSRIEPNALLPGFLRQLIWIAIFSVIVKAAWRRGLLAYEGYGG
jgi:ABC-2 type transport system permease protein